MRSLYRWEKEQKKMKINHCWIIWYILFLDYKISKRNHCENSRVHFSWAAQKISCMMIKHGAVEKTKLQDAKFNLGEQKICSWHSNLKAKFNSANRLDFSLNKSLCFERFIILFLKSLLKIISVLVTYCTHMLFPVIVLVLTFLTSFLLAIRHTLIT